MPQAVYAYVYKALAAFFVKLGAGAIAANIYAATVIKAVAYLAVDAIIRKATAPDLGGDDGSNLRSERVLKGAIESRNIIYGTQLVGGVLAYANTSGSSNKELWYVISHAGHECEDITDIWFDDLHIEAADISWGGAVTGGNFYKSGVGYVTMYKNLGTTTQTVISDLDTAFSDIDSTHRGRGVAYTVLKLTLQEESEKMFERGAPNNIRALVKGKNNVYDPRLDTSPGANPTNASYQAYTSNPILCLADYMRDSDVGMGITDARIDWQTVYDEANFCDEYVPTSTATETEKRFTANGMLLCNVTHGNNIRKLIMACNGAVAYKNGKFFIRAGHIGVGANLCTNGAFPSNITGWTNGIPARGTVVHTSNYGGGMLLTNAGSGFVRGTYPVTTVVGNTYTFKAQTKTAGANTGYLFGASNNSDGTSPHTTTTGTGEDAVYQIEFVATATTTYIVCVVNSGTVGTAIIWDNVEAYLVASRVINEDWLRDDLTMKTASPKSERFNTLNGFYRDSGENYKRVETLEVNNTAFISRDNGEILTDSFDLPFTDSEDEAQRILHKLIQTTDEQIVLSLPCNYKALNVSVHDRVMITIDELSWTNKLFRVIDWQLVGSDGGVDLVLREDSIAAYQDPDISDYTTRTAAGVIALASPEVPDPTSVTLTAHTDLPTMRIDWVNPTIAAYWDLAEVWRHTANLFSGATKLYQGRSNSYTDNLPTADTNYYYWVRMRKGGETSSEVATTPTNATAAFITATGGSADDVPWSGVLDDDGNKPADNATGLTLSLTEPVDTYEDLMWVNLTTHDTVIFQGRTDSSGSSRTDSLGATRGSWPTAIKLIGNQTATQIEDSAVNFDNRNDRNSTAIVAPTVASDATALAATIRTSGDADIQFNWSWAGDENDIDGFVIAVYNSNNLSPWVVGPSPRPEETAIIVPSNDRSINLHGLPADAYYTFAVRAYRIVDDDVDPDNIITSAYVQPSHSNEDPFQPSSDVTFQGTVTGTVGGASDNDLILNGLIVAGANNEIETIIPSTTANVSQETFGAFTHTDIQPQSLNAWYFDTAASVTEIVQWDLPELLEQNVDYVASFTAVSDGGTAELQIDMEDDPGLSGTLPEASFTVNSTTPAQYQVLFNSSHADMLTGGKLLRIYRTSANTGNTENVSIYDVTFQKGNLGVNGWVPTGGVDNNTRNVVTEGTSTPPTGGLDGDLYQDTNLNVWWVKLPSAGWTGVSDETASHVAATIASQGNLATQNVVTLSSGGDVDLYTEGTWTPTFMDASLSLGESQTYASVGRYTRSGNRVHITGLLNVTGKGSLSGASYLGGLPFTSDSTVQNYHTISFLAGAMNFSASGQSITGRITNSSTNIALQLWDSTSGVTSLLVSELATPANPVFPTFEFSGTYEI